MKDRWYWLNLLAALVLGLESVWIDGPGAYVAVIGALVEMLVFGILWERYP